MIELAEKMEQEKQFNPEEYKSPDKKQQAGDSKKSQLYINFHNPNTEEDTARYFIDLIIRSLKDGDKDNFYDRN